jgi:hypothetical protein
MLGLTEIASARITILGKLQLRASFPGFPLASSTLNVAPGALHEVAIALEPAALRLYFFMQLSISLNGLCKRLGLKIIIKSQVRLIAIGIDKLDFSSLNNYDMSSRSNLNANI